MRPEELRALWKKEEEIAHIRGWDFSHIDDRYEEEQSLPWDYAAVIRGVLKDGIKLLDYDTGGGEFLLTLQHPFGNTAATEGYPPNVQVCKERLLPLGIDLRECSDPAHIPFDDASFDVVINRHGDFVPAEIRRLLRPGGIFITQQVGCENDRDLVEMVLPDTEPPFPHLYLEKQKKAFEAEGFEILQAKEAFPPICFYDIGAFVWFARIIEWEFLGFSVDRCFDRLLKMQETLEREGKVTGTTHRYLIVARKKDLQLYIPRPEDGWFYEKMMSDPATMAYNAPWFPPDGCIPNAAEEWQDLVREWTGKDRRKFYAFLQRISDGAFVGDVNYHYNETEDRYDMGIVIYAPERGKGYGRQGLSLLLEQAFRTDGIPLLHNDFETTRGAACRIHKAAGFRETGAKDGIVSLELTREEYLASFEEGGAK